MLRNCYCIARNAANGIIKQSSAGYKSQYSLDKLYPNCNADFYSNSKYEAPVSEDEFSGYIPIDQLEINYSKSSGPGGQHVNKVNTKVEIRFHVASASWIPECVKPQLQQREGNRINKGGYLILTSDKTRKQILNQADCLEKLRSLVRTAAKRPHEPSPEVISMLSSRREKARQAMLREKKNLSMKKTSRSKPSINDF